MPVLSCLFVFFFNDTATTEIYTLSLHDALPICLGSPCKSASSHCTTRLPSWSIRACNWLALAWAGLLSGGLAPWADTCQLLAGGGASRSKKASMQAGLSRWARVRLLWLSKLLTTAVMMHDVALSE